MTKKRGNLLISIAAGAGLFIALYSIISQQFQTNKMQAELEQLQEQVEAVSDENDELAYEISIAGSEEFYRYIARERLGYHQYGETVFVNDQKN